MRLLLALLASVLLVGPMASVAAADTFAILTEDPSPSNTSVPDPDVFGQSLNLTDAAQAQAITLRASVCHNGEDQIFPPRVDLCDSFGLQLPGWARLDGAGSVVVQFDFDGNGSPERTSRSYSQSEIDGCDDLVTGQGCTITTTYAGGTWTPGRYFPQTRICNAGNLGSCSSWERWSILGVNSVYNVVCSAGFDNDGDGVPCESDLDGDTGQPTEYAILMEDPNPCAQVPVVGGCAPDPDVLGFGLGLVDARQDQSINAPVEICRDDGVLDPCTDLTVGWANLTAGGSVIVQWDFDGNGVAERTSGSITENTIEAGDEDTLLDVFTFDGYRTSTTYGADSFPLGRYGSRARLCESDGSPCSSWERWSVLGVDSFYDVACAPGRDNDNDGVPCESDVDSDLGAPQSWAVLTQDPSPCNEALGLCVPDPEVAGLSLGLEDARRDQSITMTSSVCRDNDGALDIDFCTTFGVPIPGWASLDGASAVRVQYDLTGDGTPEASSATLSASAVEACDSEVTALGCDYSVTFPPNTFQPGRYAMQSRICDVNTTSRCSGWERWSVALINSFYDITCVPGTDGDGDTVPCEMDPDGDTVSFRDGNGATPSCVTGGLNGLTTLVNLNTVTTQGYCKTKLAGAFDWVAGSFSYIQPNLSASPIPANVLFVKLISTVANFSEDRGEGGSREVYNTGSGFCIANDPTSLIRIKLGVCRFEAAFRDDRGGPFGIGIDGFQLRATAPNGFDVREGFSGDGGRDMSTVVPGTGWDISATPL